MLRLPARINRSKLEMHDVSPHLLRTGDLETAVAQGKMDNLNKINDPVGYYTALGVAIGTAFGTTFGVAFDDVGTGLGLGLCLGLAVGASIGNSKKKKQDTDDLDK